MIDSWLLDITNANYARDVDEDGSCTKNVAIECEPPNKLEADENAAAMKNAEPRHQTIGWWCSLFTSQDNDDDSQIKRLLTSLNSLGCSMLTNIKLPIDINNTPNASWRRCSSGTMFGL